jgi:hypothetical protein
MPPRSPHQWPARRRNWQNKRRQNGRGRPMLREHGSGINDAAKTWDCKGLPQSPLASVLCGEHEAASVAVTAAAAVAAADTDTDADRWSGRRLVIAHRWAANDDDILVDVIARRTVDALRRIGARCASSAYRPFFQRTRPRRGAGAGWAAERCVGRLVRPPAGPDTAASFAAPTPVATAG